MLASPEAWGTVEPVRPRRVNVEFVSANPTGPLTIGNARGAFIGDLLSRVLEAGGQEVTREYYFNDAGGQLDNLGASVLAVRRGEPIPEDGYHGAYVEELAAAVPDDLWAEVTADEANAAFALGRWAGARVREGIEASLERLGVHFDVWTTETSIHEGGWVDRGIERLRERGYLFEQDGALWFRSTDFGDDKDRVIISSNGSPTYFAADIGYVTEKFSRGFDHLIYVWGADHHGTVARVRSAAEAMGYDRGPRADPAVLVGPLRPGRRRDLHVEAVRRVRHARRAPRRGRRRRRALVLCVPGPYERDRLRHRARQEAVEREPGLLRAVRARAHRLDPAQGGGGRPVTRPVGGRGACRRTRSGARPCRGAPPEVVEDAVLAEETQTITAYATELATTFHAFYRDARVVDPAEPERSAKRLALADAARITLANALALLGISAPDSM